MKNCRVSDTDCRLERETISTSGLVTIRHIIGADGRLEIADTYYSRELQHFWQRAEGETLEGFETRVVDEAELVAARLSRRVGIFPLLD